MRALLPRLAVPLTAALVACGLAAPRTALAHAALVATEPADGANLAEAPSAIVLHFDEAVAPLALHVVGPDGAEVPPPGLPASGATLRVPLPGGLGTGVYLVGWRVVSADGHPVAGAIAFGVGTTAAPAAAQTPGESDRARAWTRLLQGLRFGFYAAFVLAAGGALFRALVTEPPRRVRRGMLCAGIAGCAAAALSVGALGGLLAEAAPWRGLLDPGAWRLGAGTPLAASLAVSAAGLLMAAASAGFGAPTARIVGVVGAVVAALGFPLAGHAATAEPRWVAAAALAAHALVVAFWLGAFWPLRALLADHGAVCAPAVGRFSGLAVPAVALLLAAGAALAALRLRTPDMLLGSAYGRLVLAKAGGFALLLALAAVNRRRLTPALAAGRDGAAARLSRGVLGEMAVAAAVLCVTVVLVRAPPPAATADHDATGRRHDPPTADGAGAAAAATEAGGVSARVEVVPGRAAGPNRLTVTLRRSAGATIPPPAEVWAELEPPAAGVGPVRRRLRREGDGRFVHDGPEFALPGRWSVRLEVLVSDFERVVLEAAVDLRPAAP
jgi:copper transport protein